MNVVSLCSGVGLIDLGLEWAGYRTVQFCEINPFGQRIIGERFPGVPIHDDAWTIQPAACDVIAAGFPCQPFSVAGKGFGADDPRHLWPAISRAIRVARPRFVILENVPGLLARGVGDVLGDLADAGFDAEWSVFSAADVGAPHLRRRVWIVATSDADSVRVWDEHGGFFREGWGTTAIAWAHGQARPMADNEWGWSGDGGPEVADAAREREREPADEAHTIAGGRGAWPEPRSGSIGIGRWWAVEPDVGGTPDGSTRRMDGGRVDGREVLRALWGASGSQTLQRAARGQRSIPEAHLLQPGVHGVRLCQACTVARWSEVAGVEAPWQLLRGVWGEGQAASPSHRRECAEQLARQHPDLVYLLSHIPPPPCAACWSDGSWESDVNRVAHGQPHRLDRLAALGNGVVPQCAELVGLRLRMLADGGG